MLVTRKGELKLRVRIFVLSRLFAGNKILMALDSSHYYSVIKSSLKRVKLQNIVVRCRFNREKTAQKLELDAIFKIAHAPTSVLEAAILLASGKYWVT